MKAALSFVATVAMMTLVFANLAQARLDMNPNGPSVEQVTQFRDAISDFLFAMKGVNGNGITACEEDSGVAFYDLAPAAVAKSTFVNCLSVTFVTQGAQKAFLKLVPTGTKVNSIFVVTKVIGPIVAQ